MQRKKIRVLIMVGGLLAGGAMFGSSNAEAGATAAMLADTCAGCHGTNGLSGGPAMPTIGGMKTEYLQAIMAEFKSGERPSTIMGRIAKGYTKEETAKISDHLAMQPWGNATSAHQSKNRTHISSKLADQGEKLVKKGKCEKCHEDNGMAQDEDTPRMAGQWVDYLIFKMHDLKNKDLNVPQPKKMAKRIKKFSVEELEAMAHFYASQK
ncbi:MAG: c-type cytochrome [Magnetococcales bacterium]|nr:c-type cytochrome [Magnetococcales bacterium]